MRICRLKNGFLDIEIDQFDDEYDIMQTITFAMEGGCKSFIFTSNDIIPEEIYELIEEFSGSVTQKNKYGFIFSKEVL